jgi:adenylate cyclase
MRFTPNIRYGTEQYPEKVARRLRAANIAAWIGAAGVGFFAVLRFLQGFAHWKYAALVALVYALVPLLHRFSPFAAPLALVAIAYAWTFWLTLNGGVAGGGTFIYFTAGAFGILLIGAERVFLSVLIGAVAVGLLIFLHIGVSPRDTVEYPMTRLIFVFNVIFFSTALFGIIFYAVRQFTFAEERAEREHQRSENLLLNILPPDVALRLKDQPDVAIADAYPDASILFADMAGFTARASKMTPQELVQFLNGVYAQIDNLVERHGLEKIKGDAAPMRIGIASGPVVAGVIGTRKFFYDVWGDAVNTASRMESTGAPGKIQVAEETRELLLDDFVFEERGVVDVRGKGPMKTWFLSGRKPAKLREVTS